MAANDRHTSSGSADIDEADLAARMRWLLRLRWLIVPVFVAVDLATGLVVERQAPWSTLLVCAVLVAANAVDAILLSRDLPVRTLLAWARFESGLVTAVPALAVTLHGDPTHAVRYGVLVGVAGAAVVLPSAGEVAVAALWGMCSLVVADAASHRFDPAFVDSAVVARWAMEAGIIVTVGTIAARLGAMRDAASRELREARARLEAQRGEFEAAFDGVHDLIFVTDEKRRVVRWNRSFARVLSLRPHEVAERELKDLLAGHPERWWSMSGDGIQEIEDPIFDTLFEVTSTRHGEQVVHVARDVGEQRRLYARLVQADKLAAVGVLASGVAHELNNPTAFVTSNLTELKRYVAAYEAAFAETTELALKAGLAERVRALLSRSDIAFARREAPGSVAESLEGMERIRQIVSNLRSLARRDQVGEPASAVDLAEVVQAVVRTAASELRSAAARVDVRGPLHVIGHRGELVDVVLNLVVNAVQAREEGRRNDISISLYREGSTAVVCICDTGRGISASHMKRLFEPFFTTKARGEGTGLGLSLARKIVLAHGGSIDVSSELGVGSVFTVRLPAHEVDDGRRDEGRRESGVAGRPESGVA